MVPCINHWLNICYQIMVQKIFKPFFLVQLLLNLPAIILLTMQFVPSWINLYINVSHNFPLSLIMEKLLSKKDIFVWLLSAERSLLWVISEAMSYDFKEVIIIVKQLAIYRGCKINITILIYGIIYGDIHSDMIHKYMKICMMEKYMKIYIIYIRI